MSVTKKTYISIDESTDNFIINGTTTSLYIRTKPDTFLTNSNFLSLSFEELKELSTLIQRIIKEVNTCE